MRPHPGLYVTLGSGLWCRRCPLSRLGRAGGGRVEEIAEYSKKTLELRSRLRDVFRDTVRFFVAYLTAENALHTSGCSVGQNYITCSCFPFLSAQVLLPNFIYLLT